MITWIEDIDVVVADSLDGAREAHHRLRPFRYDTLETHGQFMSLSSFIPGHGRR